MKKNKRMFMIHMQESNNLPILIKSSLKNPNKNNLKTRKIKRIMIPKLILKHSLICKKKFKNNMIQKVRLFETIMQDIKILQQKKSI